MADRLEQFAPWKPAAGKHIALWPPSRNPPPESGPATPAVDSMSIRSKATPPRAIIARTAWKYQSTCGEWPSGSLPGSKRSKRHSSGLRTNWRETKHHKAVEQTGCSSAHFRTPGLCGSCGLPRRRRSCARQPKKNGSLAGVNPPLDGPVVLLQDIMKKPVGTGQIRRRARHKPLG